MRTIDIAASATVLIVDDSIKRRNWFLSSYRIPHAYLAHTSDDAVDVIRRHKPEIIFLDYDLGPGIDCVPVAEHLNKADFHGTVVIHSDNPFGRDVLARLLPRARILPFGTFEVNRCLKLNG